MLGAYLRRGLAAGLIAGLLAGGLALLVAVPALDAAIRLEDPAAEPLFTRAEQKLGMLAGLGLVGAVGGLVFGLAQAWAVGRVRGDGWTRSLKLGAVALIAVVAVPALKYAPLPPGAAEESVAAVRGGLSVATAVVGLALAAASWPLVRRLEASPLRRASRQALTGVGLAVVAGVALLVAPDAQSSTVLPVGLMTRFQMGALLTQVVLIGVTAVAFGVLIDRWEASSRSRSTVQNISPDLGAVHS